MRVLLWVSVYSFFCIASLGRELEPEPEEGPPVFFASSLLAEEVLKGEHYEVAPIVRVERYRYRFLLKCEYGEVEVWGVDGVTEGAAELEAMSKLREIGQTESFTRSLSAALKSPVAGAWSVASRPVQTLKGLPMGISRYLKGKFYQVKRESQKAATYVKNNTNGSKEPKVEKGEKQPATKRIKQSTSKLSRKHLGFNKAKRDWAKRFGVDPYSKNEMLQEELGRIAWASSLGSFSADFVVPTSDALSYAGRAESVVWSKSPTELERLNHKSLKKMGFGKEEILDFHDNGHYSLTQKVELVLALEALRDVEGRLELLELAMGAEDDHDTVFISAIFDLLANYHEVVADLERIEIRRGLAVGFNAKGVMILPLALDYLHWSSEFAEALNSEDFELEEKELWVTGRVSPVSKYRLRKYSWGVEELCGDVFERKMAE